MGVPPEHIPRLTSVSYRVDAGRSRPQAVQVWASPIVKHVCSATERSSRFKAPWAAAVRSCVIFPRTRAAGAGHRLQKFKSVRKPLLRQVHRLRAPGKKYLAGLSSDRHTV